MTRGRITIAEVAKVTGVAPATVSRVLNGYEGVRPATRRRVEEAVKRLGYQPNAHARNLVNGRSRTVGLFVPHGFPEESFMPLMAGVATEVRAQGYHLLYITDPDPAGFVSLYRAGRIDGVVVFTQSNLLIFELIREKVPFSLMGRLTHEDPEVESYLRGANVDNVWSGELAARHLVELGHASFAFVGPKTDLPYTEERRRGFQSVLEKELGAGFRLVSITERPGEPTYQRVKEALAETDRPTALFCSSHYLLADVLRAAQDVELAIPAQLSIVVYRVQPFSERDDRFWTTIAEPTVELGKLAARSLLEDLERPDQAERRKTVLRTELRPGASTAAWAGPTAERSDPMGR